MIKPGEYIQLLSAIDKIGTLFFANYCYNENLERIEMFKRLDELRALHNKYKAECEHYDIYPHLNLDKMELLIEDLKRIGREFKIRIEFTTKGGIEYKSGIHANYYHEQIKITDLIVFYQKRGASHISH